MDAWSLPGVLPKCYLQHIKFFDLLDSCARDVFSHEELTIVSPHEQGDDGRLRLNLFRQAACIVARFFSIRSCEINCDNNWITCGAVDRSVTLHKINLKALIMPNHNYFDMLGKCLFVAEIGVNHNGDVAFAKQLVREAKSAGADAVKFQTFAADRLVTRGTPKVAYQEETTSPNESHFDMIQKLELGRSEHIELFEFCNALDIKFISTPYDIESAVFLDSIGVSMFKTASADLVDLPLQQFIASTGKPTMVATGMATLGEVERVVNIYNDAQNSHLILMHCVSNYPCSDSSVNLRAMTTMRHAFDTPIGFSDHSVGFLASVLSLAIGVKVIEKHFTLDKSLPGPDHKASSTPDEFAELVAQGRRAEQILGSRRKAMQAEEVQMSRVSRKSLVLSEDLPQGTILTGAHLRLMRPGTGIDASFMELLVGRRVTRDLSALDQLQWADLEVIK